MLSLFLHWPHLFLVMLYYFSLHAVRLMCYHCISEPFLILSIIASLCIYILHYISLSTLLPWLCSVHCMTSYSQGYWSHIISASDKTLWTLKTNPVTSSFCYVHCRNLQQFCFTADLCTLTPSDIGLFSGNEFWMDGFSIHIVCWISHDPRFLSINKKISHQAEHSSKDHVAQTF